MAFASSVLYGHADLLVSVVASFFNENKKLSKCCVRLLKRR